MSEYVVKIALAKTREPVTWEALQKTWNELLAEHRAWEEAGCPERRDPLGRDTVYLSPKGIAEWRRLIGL